MTRTADPHPEFAIDPHGSRKSVILPIDEYKALLEDLEDIVAVAERRGEPTVSHSALLDEQKRDGLLPD